MDINDRDIRDNLDIVVVFCLSYIIEPNRKIYFKSFKKGRVIATESYNLSFLFYSREFAMNMVEKIKHVCGCEFQIERCI